MLASWLQEDIEFWDTTEKRKKRISKFLFNGNHEPREFKITTIPDGDWAPYTRRDRQTGSKSGGCRFCVAIVVLLVCMCCLCARVCVCVCVCNTSSVKSCTHSCSIVPFQGVNVPCSLLFYSLNLIVVVPAI